MTLKFLIKLLGVKPCASLRCFPITECLCSSTRALMEVAACVPNIICIAQITCEFIYYTLLIDQGRLFFFDSQIISDLFAREHRLLFLINFSSEVAKLPANHVRRFLIFKWQRNPNRAVRRCLNWVYRMLEEAIDS